MARQSTQGGKVATESRASELFKSNREHAYSILSGRCQVIFFFSALHFDCTCFYKSDLRGGGEVDKIINYKGEHIAIPHE